MSNKHLLDFSHNILSSGSWDVISLPAHTKSNKDSSTDSLLDVMRATV